MDFYNFQNKINLIYDTYDRQKCVDNFINKLSKKDYPIFENDSTIVLFYKGNVNKVEMIGDLNYWTHPTEFNNISSTDLYYIRINIVQNSVPEYWLIIDGITQIDSLNRYMLENEFGFASQIISHRNPVFRKNPGRDKKGLYHTYRLQLEEYEDITLQVYLPPGYNDYKSYPIIFFLDGKKYIEFGDAPSTINNLIKKDKIQEMIAVFIEYGFDIEKDANRNIKEFYSEAQKVLSREILDFIENRFSISMEPEKRLLVGKSVSSGANILAAIKHSDKFGKILSQSGYLPNISFNDNVISEQKQSAKLNFLFQVGNYEKNVSHLVIPPSETDFFQANFDFVGLLRKKGYHASIIAYNAGHSWGNWKTHLKDGLIYFFAKKVDNPG